MGPQEYSVVKRRRGHYFTYRGIQANKRRPDNRVR